VRRHDVGEPRSGRGVPLAMARRVGGQSAGCGQPRLVVRIAQSGVGQHRRTSLPSTTSAPRRGRSSRPVSPELRVSSNSTLTPRSRRASATPARAALALAGLATAGDCRVPGVSVLRHRFLGLTRSSAPLVANTGCAPKMAGRSPPGHPPTRYCATAVGETVSIPGSTGIAKTRSPWGVSVLALITLGIYYLGTTR